MAKAERGDLRARGRFGRAWQDSPRARSLLTLGIMALIGVSALVWLRDQPPDAASFTTGTIPADHILLPDHPAQSVVMLFSGAAGWGDQDQALAESLQDKKAAVVGIDLPQYLQNWATKSEACHYLISDLESLSHQIQRATGSDLYQPPILAGMAEGGGLALDLVTQTPADTIGATVVADPSLGVALDRPLCTAAAHEDTPAGAVYSLPTAPISDPVTVLLSPAAGPEIRDRVTAFAGAAAPGVSLHAVPGAAAPALRQALMDQIDQLAAAPAALPLTVLDTSPTHGSMAIILSGDGGWRDLDKTIGLAFQQSGLPSVGLDSLRYFWTKRTPEDLARDLSQIVSAYSARWKTADVLLMGYSFGADVLPETWTALDPGTRARVRQVSLLGLSPDADWQITVSGWLGSNSSQAKPVAPALARMPVAVLQCVYGVGETDSPCPTLAARGGEVIKTQGGHHLDGNYPAIAQDILAGLDRRRSTDAGK